MRRMFNLLSLTAITTALSAAQKRNTASAQAQNVSVGMQTPAHGSGKPWRSKKAKRRGGK